MRNKVSILLFLLGILIVSYPLVAKIYYNYNTQTELDDLDQKIELNSETLTENFNRYQTYNESIINMNQNIVTPPVEVMDQEEYEEKSTFTDNVIATVSIPALNIRYPVYDKATEENLDRGVSRVEGTSFPTGGKDTNSVLAAHSYSPFYEWFTNIDQLKKNDVIEINNFKETLYYSVADMEVVKPDQVEKLAIRKGKDMLTLVTCTIDGSRRILVYAFRTSLEDSSININSSNSDFINESTSIISIEQSWFSHLQVLFESKWVILLVLIVTTIYLWKINRKV